MNTSKKLLERLVKLFPVKVVKDYFNTTIEDVMNKPETAVKNFCFANLNSTKQHIYIYNIDKKFNVNTYDENNFPVKVYSKTIDTINSSFICYQLIEFTVTLIEPYETKTIQFYQPILVNFIKKHLVIQITILEKNINTYFGGRVVVKSVRDISEEDIINNIRHYFDAEYTTRICDINKGIKTMWKNDLIDSRHVKWKKNKSTATEVMDENYTLKQQYPDVYNDLVKAPLNKTVFKYLKEDDVLVDHFTTEPTYGELSVPIFPKTPNQISNVISQILSSN